MPARRCMLVGSGSWAWLCGGLNSQRPVSAAIIMAPTCRGTEGTSSTKQLAATMIELRVVSGHRLPAMPQTACATTATATIFNPPGMPIKFVCDARDCARRGRFSSGTDPLGSMRITPTLWQTVDQSDRGLRRKFMPTASELMVLARKAPQDLKCWSSLWRRLNSSGNTPPW